MDLLPTEVHTDVSSHVLVDVDPAFRGSDSDFGADDHSFRGLDDINAPPPDYSSDSGVSTVSSVMPPLDFALQHERRGGVFRAMASPQVDDSPASDDGERNEDNDDELREGAHSDDDPPDDDTKRGEEHLDADDDDGSHHEEGEPEENDDGGNEDGESDEDDEIEGEEGEGGDSDGDDEIEGEEADDEVEAAEDNTEGESDRETGGGLVTPSSGGSALRDGELLGLMGRSLSVPASPVDESDTVLFTLAGEGTELPASPPRAVPLGQGLAETLRAAQEAVWGAISRGGREVFEVDRTMVELRDAITEVRSISGARTAAGMVDAFAFMGETRKQRESLYMSEAEMTVVHNDAQLFRAYSIIGVAARSRSADPGLHTVLAGEAAAFLRSARFPQHSVGDAARREAVRRLDAAVALCKEE